ncbi:MAG: hypothetical protein AAF805_15410 [Planctomycetota bacterium]
MIARRVVLLALMLGATCPAAAADSAAAMAVTGVELHGKPAPTGRVFVLIHGMAGSTRAERYTRLGDAVRGEFPDASVLLLDWSAAARPEMVGFLPNPMSVARRIDAVAASAADAVTALGVSGDRITVVGESFGVYVGAEIARRIGGVQRIVALNAANRLGGYAPTDLTRVAASSFSVVTRSVFDTRQSIAEENRVLVCPPEMNAIEQHATGVRLATEMLSSGDRSWFREASDYRALALAGG